MIISFPLFKIKIKLSLVFFGIALFSLLNSADSYSQGFHSVNSQLLLETTTSWNGENIEYPEGIAKITALKIEIEPGAETGWHHHPVPSFAYIIQGELEIILDNGEKTTATAGEVIAEVTNRIHNGKNTGDKTLILVVFYTGTEGSTLTVIH
jgi:quercetin dioxygenase-like cupin family protein